MVFSDEKMIFFLVERFPSKEIMKVLESTVPLKRVDLMPLSKPLKALLTKAFRVR